MKRKNPGKRPMRLDELRTFREILIAEGRPTTKVDRRIAHLESKLPPIGELWNGVEINMGAEAEE